jgi:hypothetical protein
MASPIIDPRSAVLDRMVFAVELVRQRLQRATAALEAAGLAYAVAGGNAVAAWVATVDIEAVRNTNDIDIIVRRSDFTAIRLALEAAGFNHQHAASIDKFIDAVGGTPRNAIHILYANEFIKKDDILPVPDVGESLQFDHTYFLRLEALVRYKLLSHRLKDQVHLQDLISLGLIDSTWLKSLHPSLADRLEALLDHPEL